MFDSNKSGKIEREKVRLILNTLGYTYDDSELDRLLSAEDTEGEFLIRKYLFFHQSYRDSFLLEVY
jgi:Ca2+-binding EF-hand superfamily protein